VLFCFGSNNKKQKLKQHKIKKNAISMQHMLFGTELKFKNSIPRCVIFFRCIPQRNRTFCVVGYNREDSLVVWDTTMKEKVLHCGIQRKKSCQISSDYSPFVFYNEGKPPLLYPTMQ
jgi:hypothetical protein